MQGDAPDGASAPSPTSKSSALKYRYLYNVKLSEWSSDCFDKTVSLIISSETVSNLSTEEIEGDLN